MFTDHSIEAIEAYDNNIRYCCYQIEECPTSKKKHKQGYLELKKPQRIAWLKEHFSKTAHFEPRKGTREEARDYCMKESTRVGEFVQHGEWKSGGQGRRSDIDKAADIITANPRDGFNEIIETMPAAFVRYHRGLRELANAIIYKDCRSKIRDITVTVITGAAGVGKTRYVFEKEPSLYILTIDSHTIWFDGYNGEEALLIDDFYGEIRYAHLLRILDRYPLKLQVKGSSLWANWTRVYLTSNISHELWYGVADVSALIRRINNIIEM